MNPELKDKLTKAAALAVALLVGAACGYYALPAKVVTKTETKEVIKEVVKTVVKEVEKKSTDSKSSVKNDKVVVIVETVLPDGTRRKETRIIDKGMITVDLSQKSEATKDTTTEVKKDVVVDHKTETTVENNKNSLQIYGIAGLNVTNWSDGPQFGLGISKRLLGPIWLGGFGTHKGNAGITLGVGF